MSSASNDDEYNDENPLAKKRRVQRACDVCRRKKIRCDSGRIPGDKCSNCSTYSLECTYVEAAKKRGPSKGYVERLENRLGNLEGLLNKFCPDRQALKDLGASELDIGSTNRPSTSSLQVLSPPSNVATSIIPNVNNPKFAPLDLDAADDVDQITRDVSTLGINEANPHFIGKSSSAILVDVAFQVKSAYTGIGTDIVNSRRKEFWSISPWEIIPKKPKKTRYTFPPPDLLNSLIHHYFSSVNISNPLFHRPIFERSIAMQLHYADDDFAAIVLLVCAIGARYSNDDRVKVDNSDDWHSSGWKWFNQVEAYQKSYVGSPTLYDLQFYCLAVLFLQGASSPHACWTMIGIGIRLAQDVGAHRRKKNMTSMTVEDEMWKRTFWVLVLLDLVTSVGLGRPCAIQDEDFDLDFPIECDDEYWFISELDEALSKPFPPTFLQQPVVFKQPADKPSLITAFVWTLKLNKVLAVLLRTIYSLKKNRVLLGCINERCEQHIISELDSALNQWVDSIPNHLRWDPHREHPQFFEQSVHIYAHYYHVQILIHRPFIPTPNKPSPTTFPSLAICTNAARSCSHILDAQLKRGLGLLPELPMPAFTAALVLLLNVWGGKRSGMTTDPVKDMLDVKRCMDALKACEGRFSFGGPLRGILRELAFRGDLPLPPSPPSNKRERGADSPASHTSPDGLQDPRSPPSMLSFSPEQQVPADVLPRTIAGTRRANRTMSQQRHGQHPQHHRFALTPPGLPVYTTELSKASSSWPSSPPFYRNTSSMYWFQGGSSPSYSSVSGSSVRKRRVFGVEGASDSSAYPAVSDAIDYEQTTKAGVEVQSYASIGGTRELHRSGYSSMQSHPTVVPSSTSSYHYGAGFLDSQGFGGRGAAPAPAPGSSGYGGGMVGPDGMDADLQELMNNDVYGMWSNAPWRFEGISKEF